MDVATVAVPHEQSRARYPDEHGYVERDGVRLYYEVYGEREPTVLLLPTWAIQGSGHIPTARDPVKVNLLLRDFIRPPRPPPPGGPARHRGLVVPCTCPPRSGSGTLAAT